MQFAFFFVLSLIVAAVHLFRDKNPRTARRVAEVLLLWLLVINVGVGGVFGFIGHTVFADRAAASIGWPAGNPFQTEVAIANLAIGVLGILCYWFRDQFWLATVIGNAVGCGSSGVTVPVGRARSGRCLMGRAWPGLGVAGALVP